MQPLFSIIMPTYNRAYVIWKAIQSIINQSEPRWELIVVNDGSTDCTLRLLEEFHEPRIRWVTTPNQGPSAARNLGVTHATAPYLAYLDSDNTWHPYFLMVMGEAIAAQPHAVLWYCNANTTFWERTDDGKWQVIWRRTGRGEPRTLSALWALQGVDTNCMVHTRTAFDAVGGWDEACRWLEDWDFFLRLFRQFPEQAHYIPYTMVEYRQVHGAGADGVCAEGRESKSGEIAGRRYLLEKWGDQLAPTAIEKLSWREEDLPLLRVRSA